MAAVRRRSGNGQTRRGRSNYEEDDEDDYRRDRKPSSSTPSGLASSNLTIVLFIAILIAGGVLFMVMENGRQSRNPNKNENSLSKTDGSKGLVNPNATKEINLDPTRGDIMKDSIARANKPPTKSSKKEKKKSVKKSVKKSAKKVQENDDLDLKVVGDPKPKKVKPVEKKKEITKIDDDDVSKTNVRMFGDNPEMLEAKKKRDKEREERRKKKANESD
ncbi:MAG: hypothetical protein COA79_23665 [Planctomycetota bacterium]|nr:MAG: hypothetical protein COA79_23665 [Planctomycetota bacterium]